MCVCHCHNFLVSFLISPARAATWGVCVCAAQFATAAVLPTTNVSIPQPMVQQACAVAGQLAGGLNPQGLATVLWALTTLLPGGTVPPATSDALQDACLRVGVDRFRSVDMTVLVGGLTRQGSIRGELAVAINRAIERSLLTYSAENLCK